MKLKKKKENKEKSMKLNWFFGMINKIDKILVRLTNHKKDRISDIKIKDHY